MNSANVLLLSWCLAAAGMAAGEGCASDDWRDICNGRLISASGGYQDQPQVVVRADGELMTNALDAQPTCSLAPSLALVARHAR